jgi:hypothetical protein
MIEFILDLFLVLSDDIEGVKKLVFAIKVLKKVGTLVDLEK